MINLLDSLNKKPTPLSTKNELVSASVPVNQADPTTTDKQAEMAPVAAQKQAEAKRSATKTQRSAQLKSEEAREPASTDSLDRAKDMISGLANLNAENLEAAYAEQTIDTTQATTPTGDELAGQIAGGLTEADIQQQASEALEGGLEGLGDFGTLTLSEVKDNPDFTDILSYATELGLDENATLNDIQSAVSDEINQITEVVDTQNEILRDPNATSMERQEAARNMIDYGAAHLIASDQELSDFENDIQNVDVMEINGQTFTLEDIEDNEAVMSMVTSAASDILNDPEAKPDWAEDHPALFNFVQKNANAVASVYLGDNSLMSNYKEVKAVVDGNKAITDSMGEGLTKALNLGVPSATDIKTDMPGLEIFSTEFNPTDLDLDAGEVQEGIKYLAGINPDLVKSLLSDPKFKERLPKVVARVGKLQNIDNAKSRVALASSLGVDHAQLEKLKADMWAHPDNYDSNQKEFIELFFTGNPKEALKSWYVNPDNVQPDLNVQTYGQKVESKISEIVDMDNLEGASLSDVNKVLTGLKKALIESPKDKSVHNLLRKFEAVRAGIHSKEEEDRRIERETKDYSSNKTTGTVNWEKNPLIGAEVAFNKVEYGKHIDKVKKNIANLEKESKYSNKSQISQLKKELKDAERIYKNAPEASRNKQGPSSGSTAGDGFKGRSAPTSDISTPKGGGNTGSIA